MSGLSPGNHPLSCRGPGSHVGMGRGGGAAMLGQPPGPCPGLGAGQGPTEGSRGETQSWAERVWRGKGRAGAPPDLPPAGLGEGPGGCGRPCTEVTCSHQRQVELPPLPLCRTGGLGTATENLGTPRSLSQVHPRAPPQPLQAPCHAASCVPSGLGAPAADAQERGEGKGLCPGPAEPAPAGPQDPPGGPCTPPTPQAPEADTPMLTPASRGRAEPLSIQKAVPLAQVCALEPSCEPASR